MNSELAVGDKVKVFKMKHRHHLKVGIIIRFEGKFAVVKSTQGLNAFKVTTAYLSKVN